MILVDCSWHEGVAPDRSSGPLWVAGGFNGSITMILSYQVARIKRTLWVRLIRSLFTVCLHNKPIQWFFIMRRQGCQLQRLGVRFGFD